MGEMAGVVANAVAVAGAVGSGLVLPALGPIIAIRTLPIPPNIFGPDKAFAKIFEFCSMAHLASKNVISVLFPP